MFEIFEKFRYFRKILILAVIIEKFPFWWKFSKISILKEIFPKILILVEMLEKLDFHEIF